MTALPLFKEEGVKNVIVLLLYDTLLIILPTEGVGDVPYDSHNTTALETLPTEVEPFPWVVRKE